MLEGWKYYNHAYLPSTPPHKDPNLMSLSNKKWDRNVLLARYTLNFDCGYETNWWWLIKDDKMDICNIKKKRRYEITKGLNNFEVIKINPIEYADQIYDVCIAAVKNYINFNGNVTKESIIEQCKNHQANPEIEYYGGFDKETKKLVGYAINLVYEEYVDFAVMKFDPTFLSKNISAAIVYTMLTNYINIQEKKYVTDGERSISHITNFQDYLIKNFGFRKAYCFLRIKYRPSVGVVIKILYPFRGILNKFDYIPVIHNIISLLAMEGIRRKFL